MSVPEIAASLLVSLSARLLKWQNPGEACGDLLQLSALKWHESIRKILGLIQVLRGPRRISATVGNTRSAQQHAVAITVKAVPALHRMPVSR